MKNQSNEKSLKKKEKNKERKILKPLKEKEKINLFLNKFFNLFNFTLEW